MDVFKTKIGKNSKSAWSKSVGFVQKSANAVQKSATVVQKSVAVVQKKSVDAVHKSVNVVHKSVNVVQKSAATSVATLKMNKLPNMIVPTFSKYSNVNDCENSEFFGESSECSASAKRSFSGPDAVDEIITRRESLAGGNRRESLARSFSEGTLMQSKNLSSSFFYNFEQDDSDSDDSDDEGVQFHVGGVCPDDCPRLESPQQQGDDALKKLELSKNGAIVEGNSNQHRFQSKLRRPSGVRFDKNQKQSSALEAFTDHVSTSPKAKLRRPSLLLSLQQQQLKTGEMPAATTSPALKRPSMMLPKQHNLSQDCGDTSDYDSDYDDEEDATWQSDSEEVDFFPQFIPQDKANQRIFCVQE